MLGTTSSASCTHQVLAVQDTDNECSKLILLHVWRCLLGTPGHQATEQVVKISLVGCLQYLGREEGPWLVAATLHKLVVGWSNKLRIKSKDHGKKKHNHSELVLWWCRQWLCYWNTSKKKKKKLGSSGSSFGEAWSRWAWAAYIPPCVHSACSICRSIAPLLYSSLCCAG